MGKKADSNQVQIVKDLRKLGFSVAVLSQVGKGVPDLLIGTTTLRGRQNILVELKDGAKFKSQQKLTKDEIEWHGKWRGQVAICNSLEQILKLCI